jgi:hypothetical protein
LDFVELQQRQVDLVVDDLVIGAVFRRELILLDGRQPIVEIGIELVLLVDARGAEVVDLFVKTDPTVLVIAGRRRPDRRERQRSMNEVVSKARKIRLGRRRCRLATC